ncbi:hypothetical protein SSEA_SKINNY_106 [Mycobacterium phage Skinny]|nr:hypothetical protein FDH95_gp132 [Mycobacterium phage Bongo]ALF00620.1 hypothetical protein SEA_BRICOLE_102 [Mycobacterium phage Bricole]AXQ52732.1 hypothetical protein SEA_IPHANE7_99 [Mycobacterium phage IPhane7]QDH93667.1 hypothetical protein SEA_LILHOMIEP_101 [Mycobacterium phage LilhomieP]QGJ93236.1 hypothetical protein SEA_TYDAWG_98 [Mycobacterium phage TyDawg]QUU29295.1 hypothetical protein [Mycobacterium phage SirSheldon]UXE05288.1 hypothetical protein SSEA_SKINNY_106 [Mycobacterium
MAEKLKSGVAAAPIVKAVNDLIEQTGVIDVTALAQTVAELSGRVEELEGAAEE